MTPAKARESEFFRELEKRAGEEQERLDATMLLLKNFFPLDDGYWSLMANGKFGVSYPEDYYEHEYTY